MLCPNVRVHSFCDDRGQHPDARRARRPARAHPPRDHRPRRASSRAARCIGFNEEEDRRRHTVTDSGIVVVTKDDEPFIGPIDEDALRNEAEFDGRGSD